jgi:hypothetical protein
MLEFAQGLAAAIIASIPKITAKFLEVDGIIHTTPHTGIDVAVDSGTRLNAVGSGVVSQIVDYGNMNIGKDVFVTLKDGTKIIYGHMSEIAVKAGQRVSAGDLIGLSGNTGRSTGPHLHLQAYDAAGQLTDPASWLEKVFTVAPFEKFTAFLDWNPFKEIQADIHAIKEGVQTFLYWINPFNWIKDGWILLSDAISNGSLDIPLILFTIIAVWLTVLGLKQPKKWAFWTWVIFWILRGFILV